MNRLLTGRIAVYHFTPTQRNAENLKKENAGGEIFITGNTVIDAFKTTVKDDYIFNNPVLQKLDYTKHKVILITAHRRENLGEPLVHICRALKQLTKKYSDIKFVYLVHLNPAVRETVYKILNNNSQVELLEPLDVLDMHNLIARSFMVMTDSGGLQEEEDIFHMADELLGSPEKYSVMARAVNPYGDSRASERIVKILLENNTNCQ